MTAFCIQEHSSTQRLLRLCQQALRPLPEGFGLWRDGSKSDFFTSPVVLITTFVFVGSSKTRVAQ